MSPDIECLVEKLLRNREKLPNGCWNWTGAIRKDGYGEIRFRDQVVSVPRIVAWLCLGLIREDNSSSNYVLHSCDNRRCFNPAHLSKGSQSKNLSNRLEIGKSCRKGHLITPENLYYWNGRRYCRTCMVLNEEKRTERRRLKRVS